MAHGGKQAYTSKSLQSTHGTSKQTNGTINWKHTFDTGIRTYDTNNVEGMATSCNLSIPDLLLQGAHNQEGKSIQIPVVARKTKRCDPLPGARSRAGRQVPAGVQIWIWPAASVQTRPAGMQGWQVCVVGRYAGWPAAPVQTRPVIGVHGWQAFMVGMYAWLGGTHGRQDVKPVQNGWLLGRNEACDCNTQDYGWVWQRAEGDRPNKTGNGCVSGWLLGTHYGNNDT
eukprot:747317-Pelagomonas_calceolata.AAC.6